MKQLFAIAFLCLSCTSFAQTDSTNVQFLNPSTVAKPNGYSHAAVIDLGTCTMVILSGQVALDQQGNLVGKGDMEKQAEQVFRNIKAIAEAAGGSMDHVVKLNFLVTDVAHIQAIRRVRDRFINTKTPPASTLAQVSRLFRDDILIEIEATLVIPRK
jgi:2-iminobutanoate/2-iminopropanoate deaminase